MNPRTIYNGNDVDRTIPYTSEAYTPVTDDDYLPLPGPWYALFIRDVDGSVVRWY